MPRSESFRHRPPSGPTAVPSPIRSEGTSGAWQGCRCWAVALTGGFRACHQAPPCREYARSRNPLAISHRLGAIFETAGDSERGTAFHPTQKVPSVTEHARDFLRRRCCAACGEYQRGRGAGASACPPHPQKTGIQGDASPWRSSRQSLEVLTLGRARDSVSRPSPPDSNRF